MTLEYQNLSGAPSRAGLTTYGVISVIIGGAMLMTGICSASVLLAMAPRAVTAVTYTSTGTTNGAPTTGPVTTSGGLVTLDYASSSITAAPTTGPGVAVVSTTRASSSTVIVGMTGAATTLPTLTRSAAVMTAVMAGVIYVGGGAVALLFGVGMLRARAWVRPWVVALSGLGWITMAAGVPNTIIMISQQSFGVAVPTWSLYLGIGVSTVFGVGLPLAYFIYFSRERVGEVARYYNPGPTWTDRWPLGVFCVMVAAGFQTLTGLASLAFLASQHAGGAGAMSGYGVGGETATVLGSAVQTLASATVLALSCRRSRWAFPAAWVSLALQAGVIAVMVATGYQPQVKEFAASFPGATVPKVSAAMLLVPMAFGVALWFCQRQARRFEVRG